MLIVGNLDVESHWARMDAAARRARGEKAPRPDDPRFALPEPVMKKISAAATLMRVAAMNDLDTLWTPRPVEPSRMARIEWLPTPRLVSGPMPEAADVWWGEPTEVAARVNHRSFLHDLRVGDLAVPGAVVVRTLDELAAQAAETASWVAKAPHSAAGRLRVRGERGPLGDAAKSQAKRLIDVYGCLMFEPWFDRSDDFGVPGVKHALKRSTAAWSADRPPALMLRTWPPHQLIVDRVGRFVGIVTPMRRDERERTSQFLPQVDAVTDALDRGGYTGPFGVDMFHAATPDGATRLVVSEVNGRMTFGHVAAELAKKARAFVGVSIESPVALRFGAGAPPDGSIPLLLPAPDDDTCAWLEVQNVRRD